MKTRFPKTGFSFANRGFSFAKTKTRFPKTGFIFANRSFSFAKPESSFADAKSRNDGLRMTYKEFAEIPAAGEPK